MGSAIAERIKDKYSVFVYDKDKNKLSGLKDIKLAKNNIDLVGKADVVILAVKPQDVDIVLAEIKNYIKGKLIVSIAAGIATSHIEKRLNNTRVVRAMPNLLAKIGKSMSCLSKGKSAKKEDLNLVDEIFKNLGETLIIDENKMPAATAVSGSGPGFYFEWIQSQPIENYHQIPIETTNNFIIRLTEAAKTVGFNPAEAELLASHTGANCAIFVAQTNLSLQKLVIQVASRGGTTEVGLNELRRGGSLEDAVMAAKKRAEELSKKE